MGARGPKPTPTKILESRGSWRASDRADSGEPLYPVEVPTCPDWLPREAKAEWSRVVKYLESSGVIAKVNRATLAAYCSCWAAWVEAEKEIKKDGKVLDGVNGGKYQNPWVAIANASRIEMVRLAAEFGMTPATAPRITPAIKDEVEKDDKKSRFFGTVG